jgi:hypothetical protein
VPTWLLFIDLSEALDCRGMKAWMGDGEHESSTRDEHSRESREQRADFGQVHDGIVQTALLNRFDPRDRRASALAASTTWYSTAASREVRSRSGFVRTMGSPPAADTRCRPVADTFVAKMIVPSGPHVAPRGPPPSTGPIVTGGPPVMATFLSRLRHSDSQAFSAGPMPRETIMCLLGLHVPVQFIQGNGDRVVAAQMAGIYETDH